MSKEITKEEACEKLITHIQGLISYWENVKDPQCSRVFGVAHSILSTLDGCSGSSSGFHLINMNSQDDIDYLKERGEDYHPMPPKEVIECDIVKNYLHDRLDKKD